MEGLIQLSYLPTESQLADVLTKILPSQQHWSLLHKLGMLPYSQLERRCWRPSQSESNQQQVPQDKIDCSLMNTRLLEAVRFSIIGC